MAKLQRGIQLVKWHNDDGTKSVRYRVRIQRKTFQADKLFDTLEEAEDFLADSRSQAGRKVLSEQEQAQKEKNREMAELAKAPPFSWFLNLYRKKTFPTDDEIKKLPEQESSRKMSAETSSSPSRFRISCLKTLMWPTSSENLCPCLMMRITSQSGRPHTATFPRRQSPSMSGCWHPCGSDGRCRRRIPRAGQA